MKFGPIYQKKHTRSLLYISSDVVGNSQQKGALHLVKCTGPAFPQEYPYPEQPAINTNHVSNLVSSSRYTHEGISLIVSIELQVKKFHVRILMKTWMKLAEIYFIF